MLSVAVVMISATAILLIQLRSHQKLGPPAVKTTPLPDPQRLAVQLPENVLDYKSEPMEISDIELKTLPADTSFGRRQYIGSDKWFTMASVVLMGSDRTSLHKTEYCLQGQGWRIDRNASVETKVHLDRPCSYDLPMMKYIVNRDETINGQRGILSGVYVFWFVAPNEITAHHGTRMWSMATKLIKTGVLERWAMISYFSVCNPGEEDATFERMKKVIVASVPEFQLTPAAGTPASGTALITPPAGTAVTGLP
jgi:hypothetical protein